MIQKRLEEVTQDDILALIINAVAEGRTIEYKRDLPGGSDGDKKEFLADASSFANTAGGDMVFGVREDKGVPTQIVGVQSGDIDLEIQRLDSLLASSLEPRIRYARQVVDFGGKRVLLIRVERSWSGPHRVVFKGHDKFYGRNSAGKYSLDVNELRVAFTLASTVTERIRAFRVDRVIALTNNQTPIPFEDKPKVVLHCIPIESFAGQVQYDLQPLYQKGAGLSPMFHPGSRSRPNLEGRIAFDGFDSSPSTSYAQVYRNGVIEAVAVIGHEYEGSLIIPSLKYERGVLEYLPSCFRILTDIGASVPIVVALALTNTHGLRMAVKSVWREVSDPIEANTIIIPETVVQDLSQPTGQILKPMFDIVWNACGYPCSTYFDPEGNWIGGS